MLDAGHLAHVEFNHFTAPWIPKGWHTKIQRVSAPSECRIWGRTWPVGGDCCLWLGANDGKKNGRVHGVIKINGRKVYIHRHALAKFLGVDIDTFLHVDHICRNSTCFNPYHLEDTTPQINTHRGDAVLYKPPSAYGSAPELTDDEIAALAGDWKAYK